MTDVQSYADGLLAGDRSALARAVTLIESSRADHREAAKALLQQVIQYSGQAHRVGITGVPGVGKSTFIDTLGSRLLDQGHRVAVLAVDPSSTLTGGSILGDRTRMTRLSQNPAAFVRPSPSGGTLGGVARATRETMLLMEAAGFDIVLVETVGVGQSEVLVSGMVDTSLFLTIARTGDDLQGVKRGILELADVLAVNKADGSHEKDAQRAARELQGALRLLRGGDPDAWKPPVLACSAQTETGIDEVWAAVTEHRQWLIDQGRFDQLRARQAVEWSRAMVRERLLDGLRADDVRPAVVAIEAEVAAGRRTPDAAADEIVGLVRARH